MLSARALSNAIDRNLKRTFQIYPIIRKWVFHKPVVFVIGDSHTISFLGEKIFRVYHLGAATAYNLKNANNSTKSNEQLFHVLRSIDKRKDIVILTFGEIDCRIHIYNQFKKNAEHISVEELINKTINSYGEVMKRLDAMGIDFFIYSVPPASRQENFYNYPFYANQQMRIEINKKFNQLLKQYCLSHNYKYIDIYSHTADNQGLIKLEYARDDVHLRNITHYVKEVLSKKYKWVK
jgi:lysophospholipase L1-like esterase